MDKEMEFLQNSINLIIEFFVQYSFQILGAIIILVIGFKLAGWVAKLVVRLCERHKLDVTLSRFLGNVTKVLILVFVVIISVEKFGISIAPFIAALGAVAFGSSFALAGPLSNYGAGLTIILSRPFLVGNTITVQGVSGVVDEIRLAATILSTEDGEVITIPNKRIVGEIIHNSFENKIVETSVGIDYSDDPAMAVKILRDTLAGISGVCAEPAPQIGIEEFADSSINIGLRYWVETKKYFQIQYAVNMAVHQSLADGGISIPFPQRDVHLVGQPDSSSA